MGKKVKGKRQNIVKKSAEVEYTNILNKNENQYKDKDNKKYKSKENIRGTISNNLNNEMKDSKLDIKKNETQKINPKDNVITNLKDKNVTSRKNENRQEHIKKDPINKISNQKPKRYNYKIDDKKQVKYRSYNKLNKKVEKK